MIDGVAKEVLRCFADTIMVTARPDTKLGTFTDTVEKRITASW